MAPRPYSLKTTVPPPGIPIGYATFGGQMVEVFVTEDWRFGWFENVGTALFGPTGDQDVTQNIPSGSYVGSVAVTPNLGLSISGAPGPGYAVTLSLAQDIRTTASPQFGGLNIQGNIVCSGTVDTRDVSVDGAKLDGIASGATANATDAFLRARANHTGTQTASTISDFNTAADARVAAGITGKADKQGTTLTDASTSHGVTDFATTNAALDVMGARLNAALAVMRAAGIGT